MTLAELEQIVLALPPNDRELLVTRVLSSLDTDTDESDLPPGWRETIASRRADFENGSELGIPAEQAFDEIRKELGWK